MHMLMRGCKQDISLSGEIVTICNILARGRPMRIGRVILPCPGAMMSPCKKEYSL